MFLGCYIELSAERKDEMFVTQDNYSNGVRSLYCGESAFSSKLESRIIICRTLFEYILTLFCIRPRFAIIEARRDKRSIGRYQLVAQRETHSAGPAQFVPREISFLVTITWSPNPDSYSALET